AVCGIRFVEQRLRLMELVPLHAVDEQLIDAFACGGIEPNLALFDRPAERDARLAILFERTDPLWIEVPRDQVVVDVARLQRRTRMGKWREAGDLIPAVTRHHLQYRAAEIRFRVAAAGRGAFLDVQLTEDEDADGDARNLLVNPVDVRLCLGRAVQAEA